MLYHSLPACMQTRAARTVAALCRTKIARLPNDPAWRQKWSWRRLKFARPTTRHHRRCADTPVVQTPQTADAKAYSARQTSCRQRRYCCPAYAAATASRFRNNRALHPRDRQVTVRAPVAATSLASPLLCLCTARLPAPTGSATAIPDRCS